MGAIASSSHPGADETTSVGNAHSRTHTCTHVHVCRHTRHLHAHTCMDTILHTILHAYKCIHVHIPAGIQAFMYTPTCIHLYALIPGAHTCIVYIHAHPCKHARVHTLLHVYTPTQDGGQGWSEEGVSHRLPGLPSSSDSLHPPLTCREPQRGGGGACRWGSVKGLSGPGKRGEKGQEPRRKDGGVASGREVGRSIQVGVA